MSMDIVCMNCLSVGEVEPEIAIEEEDTLARCERCGRRYRVFTGDLARANDDRRIDAVRSSYTLYLAPSERLPQRWRITAEANLKFERGYRYSLVWYQGRLVGIADQTSGQWIPIAHVWRDDVVWRFAWGAVAALIVLNLYWQLDALRSYVDQGGIYWLGPVVIVLALIVAAGRWLFTAEH